MGKKHVGQPFIFGDVYLPVYFALFSFIWLDVITVRCIFLIKLFMLEQALTDAVTSHVLFSYCRAATPNTEKFSPSWRAETFLSQHSSVV